VNFACTGGDATPHTTVATMTSTAPPRRFLPCILSLFLLLHLPHSVDASFEPYQLNGGLVAAVAGKDYCVVASDTRMMDGSYEIYTRRYLTSRLWNTGESGDEFQLLCESDGSLSMPKSSSEASATLTQSPVWIASSGCAADCEALKRGVRMEVKASKYWNTALKANHIATLLSQVLYSRRNFPFYSFCVVAGMDDEGEPAAYVYDAIGSYEQVAVATSGTGRELLQPILDRLFASSSTTDDDDDDVKGPINTIAPRTMPRVVDTHVQCSADEAVARLVRGYKSVAERDIGVGDSVVLCVTQQSDHGQVTCRVISVLLKTH